MKKLLFFSLFAFVLVALFNTCSVAQPQSDYKLPWISEANSQKYYIFYEEGTSSNPASYTLQDGMSYYPTAIPLYVDSVFYPTAEYIMLNISNDGKYIVFGIVGIASDGIWGQAGVSMPFLKPTAPGKVVTLPPVRLEE